jgi:hypothetical protein
MLARYAVDSQQTIADLHPKYLTILLFIQSEISMATPLCISLTTQRPSDEGVALSTLMPTPACMLRKDILN